MTGLPPDRDPLVNPEQSRLPQEAFARQPHWSRIENMWELKAEDPPEHRTGWRQPIPARGRRGPARRGI